MKMPQLSLRLSVYEGAGWSHKLFNSEKIATVDMLRPEITEESIAAAHHELDIMITEYLVTRFIEKAPPKPCAPLAEPEDDSSECLQ
jgi:hypothetical protein